MKYVFYALLLFSSVQCFCADNVESDMPSWGGRPRKIHASNDLSSEDAMAIAKALRRQALERAGFSTSNFRRLDSPNSPSLLDDRKQRCKQCIS